MPAPGVQKRVELLIDLPLDTGECPHWNPIDNCLYWIDVPSGRVYRYAAESGKTEVVYYAKQQVGSLLIAEDGSLILGLEEGRVENWSQKEVRVLCQGIEEQRGNRFNDGIVDPQGRILLGTMPGKGTGGRLYRFSVNGSIEILLADAGQSNGMAFSFDGATLYHTDTLRRTISAYAYGQAPLTGGQTIVRLVEDKSVPDGLAIDAEGRLWSAHFGGHKLCCYGVDGTELESVELPVARPTSLAFGGKDLDRMFITSAGGPDRKALGRYAGSVFVEKISPKGMPSTLAKVAAGSFAAKLI